MTCPNCGRGCADESEKCPYCLTLLRTPQSEKSNEPRTTTAPKSVGVCPDCGTEQLGTVYRVSSVVAAFLKPKHEDTFVPDRHRCVRKSAAG